MCFDFIALHRSGDQIDAASARAEIGQIPLTIREIEIFTLEEVEWKTRRIADLAIFLPGDISVAD